MLRIIPWLLIASALSGCGTANLHSEPVSGTNISNRVPVSLGVSDQRKFVLSGEKSPSFLGKSGDLTAYTADKAPLADHLKRDLLQELRSLGFDEQASSDSRQMTVTIQDWNTDGLYFWYDVAISVTSPEGNVLAQSVINGKKSLDIGGGALFGVTAGMPKVYGETIKALVRDNPDVYFALQTGTVAKKAEELNTSKSNLAAVETKSSPAKKEFEQYVGIFGGNAQVADAQVNVSESCFLFSCTPPASQNFQFEKGSTNGVRWGMWREYFGVAMELSSTTANSKMNDNGSRLHVGYTSLSLIPMLRVPFFKTDSMPGGRINLYGGVGLSDVSGNIDATIPPLQPTSRNVNGIGTIALIGVSLRYSRFMIFAEQRATETSLSSDDWAPSASVTVPISTNETVMGIAYRF